MLTIKINDTTPEYNIKSNELEDGKIYQNEGGRICIGSCCIFSNGQRTYGFSLDGKFLVHHDSEGMYREIDATITVNV